LVGSLRGERKTKNYAKFLIEEELDRAIRHFSKGKLLGKKTFKDNPAQGSNQNNNVAMLMVGLFI
jgi:hypothetical protein